MIEFQHVTKKYGKDITAVEDVNFKIGKGEFVTLVGPSGAGKSTLIKMLIREEEPSSGRILVADRDIFQLKERELPYYRRKVGVVFQDFKLLARKTIYENVAFALEVAGVMPSVIKKRVGEMLTLVGLDQRPDALAEELSGGEKQRVSIARALIHEPKLLIADEPTGNLDPINSWEIIELLFKINKQGTIVLLATHDKEIVDAIHKRVVTMKDGKVVDDRENGKYIL